MTGRLEALHASLTLTRWPVRVLASVVEVTALTMFNTRQYLALGCIIAPEFIRDDHSWYVHEALEQLAKKLPDCNGFC
jgi:hypothetical protein